ncbi:MAG: hypothetical protein RLZZ350_131 [Verrucomicrobiota bacterium]|jgi:hypothetical protein
MISPAKIPRAVWLLALASLAFYALLPGVAAGLTLAEPSFAGEVFGWVKQLSPSALVALHDGGSHKMASVWFVTIMVGLFASYAFALKRVAGIQSLKLQAFVFGAGALFLGGLLLAPVMLSSDVFAYALYGRVAAVYHANPYDLAPVIAANDSFLKLFGQEYLPSWYGPVWTLISTALAKLGGEHVGLTVLLFRGTAVAGALTCAGLIWASLRRFAPERATQGLVFFLWNPLLVMETGLSGHNDSVMLALVLLAVWLHLRGWKTGAVVALTLSALVKFLTGMLVPLYVLLVLRELGAREQPWLRALWTVNLRPKLFFLARSGVAAALVVFTATALTKSNSGSPASQAAVAPDFYQNNFHELIFKGIRRTLGENAESVRTPIYFQGWWLAASTNTFLRAAPNDEAEVREFLDPGAKLLVVAPQPSDWARVYDPVSKQFGYADTTSFSDAPKPTLAETDATVTKYETMAADWPTVRTANNIVRVMTWILFAAFGLLCAWRTDSFEEFLVWSVAALLASYFLILTEIWPWYVNWAVALAAFAPQRAPARLALLLSAGVMTLDVTLGFVGGEPAWVATYRSLPAFVLPLILWAWWCRRRPCASKPG